jgi:hypothetical protein
LEDLNQVVSKQLSRIGEDSSNSGLFESLRIPSPVVNELILEYLLRQDVALAQTFASDAKIEIPEQMLKNYEDFHKLSSAIEKRETEPCLEYLKKSLSIPVHMQDKSVSIAIQLHSLQIISLSNSPSSAITYARQHLPQYSDSHLDSITSASQYILSPPTPVQIFNLWNQVSQQLMELFCDSNKIPRKSPLLIWYVIDFHSSTIWEL